MAVLRFDKVTQVHRNQVAEVRDFTVTDEYVPHAIAAVQLLGQHPAVTIRVYEPDNHFFFPGIGPSTPAEYEPAQHMNPTVVADIANWLIPTRPTPAELR
ncbi:MAG: hypothetical protein M3Y48_19090 [Actinomycetota bacterium]|nr:hypothetical protein [Actinomycetota bacterium]